MIIVVVVLNQLSVLYTNALPGDTTLLTHVINPPINTFYYQPPHQLGMLALLWQRNSDNTATCCCGTCSGNGSGSSNGGGNNGCIGRWRTRARLGHGLAKGPGLGDMDGLEDEGEPVVPVCPCCCCCSSCT